MVHFEAEKSYTGEDLFELHLHGSKAIVSAVFRELAKMDFKPAKRGEFTRRAMLNGRMSLL
jgi:tRNA modification GTPase